MKHDITITMLNWNGNLFGGHLTTNAKGRAAQANAVSQYVDRNVGYDIAVEVVDQMIANSCNFHVLNH